MIRLEGTDPPRGSVIARPQADGAPSTEGGRSFSGILGLLKVLEEFLGEAHGATE